MHRLFRHVLPLLVVFTGAIQFAPTAQAQAAAQADHAVVIQHGYQKAPHPIHDILDGPPTHSF